MDDHPVVRTGVRKLIGLLTNFEIVGEASGGLEALEMARALNPQVVVLDVSMPGLGGMDTIAGLRRDLPKVQIVVFSMYDNGESVRLAIDAGADAYVCKIDTDHLLPALEAVVRGKSYFSPAISDEHMHQSQDEAWDARPLTARERQIVTLVALGHSNRGIAGLLNISIKTTETHRASAMRKTGTKTAAALTMYAARMGLVEI